MFDCRVDYMTMLATEVPGLLSVPSKITLHMKIQRRNNRLQIMRDCVALLAYGRWVQLQPHFPATTVMTLRKEENTGNMATEYG